MACVVLQQAHGFEQQIVEIQRVGLRSAFSYSLEDDGELRDIFGSVVSL